MSTVTKKKIPRTFRPLSRSAYRYAQKNDIGVQQLGTKQNKWITALLSGKYKKAKGMLCAVDKRGNAYHCCLGVACEITPKINIEEYKYDEGLRDRVNGRNSAYIDVCKLFNDSENVLPDDLAHEYEFYSDEGKISYSWAGQFIESDKQGVYKECNSLKEIRKYVKKFFALVEVFAELTAMNDGKWVEESKIDYTHKEIANFVKAYPQAIFENVV